MQLALPQNPTDYNPYNQHNPYNPPTPLLPPSSLHHTKPNIIPLGHQVHKPSLHQALGNISAIHDQGGSFSKPSVPSQHVIALPKLLIIPAVIIPVLISMLLLHAHRTRWSAPDSMLIFTLANRSTVQIVVQILSHILGVMQTYVICTLIAFGVRIRLTKTYTSLKFFKFFSAIASTRFDFGLPIHLLLQLALFNSLNLWPSALWAGSITPIVAISNASAGSIAIANFSRESRGYWNVSTVSAGNCSTFQNVLGKFSTCPGLFDSDMFVSAAATASTPSGEIRNDTKNDDSQFAYIGRSYGVGSSVGLTPVASAFTNSFEYTEYGYNTSVTCTYNSTSSWGRRLVQEGKPGNGIPYIYYALGYLPNSNLTDGVDFFALVGLGGDDAVVAYASKCGMGRYIYAFTAGKDYAVLDNIQCEVSFTACEFHVVVSPLERKIVVKPVRCGGPDVIDVDPTGGLRCRIMAEPSISSLVSTTLYVSQIGQALLTNIANLHISTGAPLGVPAANATVLHAVGMSLTATIDKAFSMLSSSQLLIAKSTTAVPVRAMVQALVFGQAWTIYTVCAMSMLILLIAIEEALRTRFWHELPMFNFMDVKSCVVGGALGGRSITEAIAMNLGPDAWIGDDMEPRIDKVKVKLKVDATGVFLEAEKQRAQ